MNLQLLFDSGRVQRYHSNPQLARHGQTNADHQWGCVALLLALHPNPSRELMRAALFHDVEEVRGGDLDFHFKREHPQFTREHERLSRMMAEEAGLPTVDCTDPWLNLVDRLESFLYMRMYGQEWDHTHIKKIIRLSEDLKIKFQIEEIIHGK